MNRIICYYVECVKNERCDDIDYQCENEKDETEEEYDDSEDDIDSNDEEEEDYVDSEDDTDSDDEEDNIEDEDDNDDDSDEDYGSDYEEYDNHHEDDYHDHKGSHSVCKYWWKDDDNFKYDNQWNHRHGDWWHKGCGWNCKQHVPRQCQSPSKALPLIITRHPTTTSKLIKPDATALYTTKRTTVHTQSPTTAPFYLNDQTKATVTRKTTSRLGNINTNTPMLNHPLTATTIITATTILTITPTVITDSFGKSTRAPGLIMQTSFVHTKSDKKPSHLYTFSFSQTSSNIPHNLPAFSKTKANSNVLPIGYPTTTPKIFPNPKTTKILIHGQLSSIKVDTRISAKNPAIALSTAHVPQNVVPSSSTIFRTPTSISTSSLNSLPIAFLPSERLSSYNTMLPSATVSLFVPPSILDSPPSYSLLFLSTTSSIPKSTYTPVYTKCITYYSSALIPFVSSTSSLLSLTRLTSLFPYTLLPSSTELKEPLPSTLQSVFNPNQPFLDSSSIYQQFVSTLSQQQVSSSGSKETLPDKLSSSITNPEPITSNFCLCFSSTFQQIMVAPSTSTPAPSIGAKEILSGKFCFMN